MRGRILLAEEVHIPDGKSEFIIEALPFSSLYRKRIPMHFSEEQKLTAPSMVDEQELFTRVVRRLFDGTVRELLGEVLQNCQRAGATRVDITFPCATRCVIGDNGSGLSGFSDLDKLLRLAASHYDNELVEENQAPAGVGFYALIVHTQVHMLRVESNGIALTIETQRWLGDKVYRDSWPKRVERLSSTEEKKGTCLTIDGEELFMVEIRSLLNASLPHWVSNFSRLSQHLGPARGYEGILDIRLDGHAVPTQLPEWITLPDAEIVESYQGNVIRIKLARGGGPQLVALWYGQVIVLERPVPYRVYLDVRRGRPVTPKVPTRQGLIKDAQLEDLFRWVEDRVFAHVCMAHAPTPSHISLLYSANRQRAERECPFAVVRQWRGLPFTLIESLEDAEDEELSDEMVVRKDVWASKHILPSHMLVLLPKDHPALPCKYRDVAPNYDETLYRVQFGCGLTSLIRATGLEAYANVVGLQPTGVLWWRPGPPVDAYHTTNLGEWGIGSSLREPAVWHPVTSGNVYAVDGTQSWSIDERAWVIGVTETTLMPRFWKNYGWVAWVPDEDNPDMSAQDFGDSLDSAVRRYLDATIACSTPIADLASAVQPFLADEQSARDATYQLVFENSAHSRASKIRVLLPDGGEKLLELY
jgi:hypothetical protein